MLKKLCIAAGALVLAAVLVVLVWALTPAREIPSALESLDTSIEDVRAAAPDGRLWYQLYVMKDREISYGLAERAAAAGYDSLLFTVDTPIAGNRMRDARNGFSIPPQLTARTILDAIPRPWWWAAM